MKKRKLSPEKWKSGGILAALLAAVAVFLVMLRMEKNMLEGYEKGEVLVAVREIPKGQVLTEECLDTCLEYRQMDIRMIPDTAIRRIEELREGIPYYTIEQGSVITKGMFYSREKLLETMAEPVIAGVKADDFYQVAGGILRAGDRIHLYAISESKQAEPIGEAIYVQQVFDSGGREIPADDRTTAAGRLNLYLDKSQVERIYSALASGTLRAVKVCR